MLVPLAGRMLHSHADSAPGTVMESTTGAIQNTSPEARDATVVLLLEERNSVKLTEAITDFQFLSLGGLAVWTPYAMIGACIIEIPLFGFLAVRSYCGHTVN